VSADGTMVHDRAIGTELEVKIGLVFDGVRRIGRTRRALTGRTLHAGTEGWTAWAERFTALCTRLAVYEADRILFVSDGAASIRWIRERSFPTAIELLDWYHLADALRGAIGPERPDRLEAALAVAAGHRAPRVRRRCHGSKARSLRVKTRRIVSLDPRGKSSRSPRGHRLRTGRSALIG